MGSQRSEPVALAARHARSLRRDGPYRPPTAIEVDRLTWLVDALATGSPTLGATAASCGLRVVPVADQLALAPAEPGGPPWVLAMVRPDVVPTVLVEVPHPGADLHTESVGAQLVLELPSAILLQAGAHRVAGAPADARTRVACPADVAARADAVFSRLADGLVSRLGIAQVQWHGFADRHGSAGVDVVVSPGAAAPGPLFVTVTDALRRTGESVAGPDDPRAADLLGRRNVQGRAAARHGAEFVHLELSRSLRDDARRRSALVRAVGEAVRGFGGVGGPATA